jgi:hypothetical protein
MPSPPRHRSVRWLRGEAKRLTAKDFVEDFRIFGIGIFFLSSKTSLGLPRFRRAFRAAWFHLPSLPPPASRCVTIGFPLLEFLGFSGASPLGRMARFRFLYIYKFLGSYINNS